MPLHETDTARLSFLRDHYAQHRLIPSYTRLASLLGYKSASAAQTAIKRLMALGYFEVGDGKRIAPTKKFFELPLAGAKVPAGLPTELDDLEGSIARIDELLVPHPSKTFLLEIEGDSMIEAGLMPGDYVVVERRQMPLDGDIVVATVDGRHTVKFFKNDGHAPFLRPANKTKAYADIKPKERLDVSGVVIGSFRRISRGR